MLWALRVARGVEAEPEPDFVRRNYWKGALALGDATLLAHGRYATPGATRAHRLRILEASNPAVERLGLGADYESALRFKLEPDSLSPDAPPLEALRELALRWGGVLLHVESRRTGRTWESLEAYADWEGPPEADENRLSRRVANLVRTALSGAVTAAHPRERLYRRLPLLLVGEGPSRAAWDTPDDFAAVHTSGFASGRQEERPAYLEIIEGKGHRAAATGFGFRRGDIAAPLSTLS